MRPRSLTGMPWPFAQSITVSDFILPTTATASTLDALIYLAESDMGIACVPNFCVRRQIADGTLISVLKGCIERIEVVRAMWPSSQFQSPKLRVFIDFVAENLLPKLPLNPKTHEFATVR